MPHDCDRSFVTLTFPLLIFLSGCGGDRLACDTIETRSEVLRIVADDRRNPLINFAASNSSAKAGLEKAKPMYLLDEKIVTVSTSRDKRTLQCHGGISVAVGDIKATKDLDFTVQRSSDGKTSVSVEPFQF
jgi:hypothetical protein